MTAYPIEDEFITGFRDAQPYDKPAKPVAFITGHGLWNDMQIDKTQSWLTQVGNATEEAAPWTAVAGQMLPRLFLTPNAAHDEKPDMFLQHQGNVAVSRFEKKAGELAERMGWDHLGTYNMSIQASSHDGT